MEGTGGRGFMKAREVLGGSMLGITFFHDSSNAESGTAAAGTSAVENGRHRKAEEEEGRIRRRVTWRNMTGFGSLGSQGRRWGGEGSLEPGSARVGEQIYGSDEQVGLSGLESGYLISIRGTNGASN